MVRERSLSCPFIKLSEFPDNQILDEWYQIQSNLLEAIFCKAFFTHHGALEPTTQPSTHITDLDHLGYGLNIVTPLIQGKMLPAILGLGSSAVAMNSPDPQIRYWASFRPAQKSSALPSVSQPLQFRTDFFEALRLAVADDNIFQSFIKDLPEKNKSCSKAGPTNKPERIDTGYIPFTGTLSANIGFVLDFELVSQADDSEIRLEEGERPKSDLHWQLEGCGFNTTNIIV
ncbi:hypothetical protein V8C37DRAFT_266370 [Trichoderma ceciliae]